MSIELQAANEKNGPQPQDDVQQMRSNLRAAISSSKLNGKDRQMMLDWLQADHASFDAQELKLRIQHLPQAVQASEDRTREYEKQIDAAIAERIFSPKSRNKYMAWFKELSYADKIKYLEDSDLKNPRRRELLTKFDRLPAVVRSEMCDEFLNADLEKREKLITGAAAAHEALKAQFLKLPPALREKYREQFKAANFAERASLLKSIGAIESDSASPEKQIEELQLIIAFEKKMAQKTDENLFSKLSAPAYSKWYKTLSLEEKREKLAKSDLDDPRRKIYRDRFYALPPEIQKKHALEFREADLEGRIALLERIEGKHAKTINNTTSYPKDILRHEIEKAAEDPSLRNARLLFTMARDAARFKKKAELRYEALHTKDIARKASKRGNKVDEHLTFRVQDLRHHVEKRSLFRRFFMRKREGGDMATANNLTVRNDNLDEISADQTNALIVEHLRKEALAGIRNRVAQKLPQLDTHQLEREMAKFDLTVDLRKTLAA